MDKIRIGLLVCNSYDFGGGPAKLTGVIPLLLSLHSDKRFDISIVATSKCLHKDNKYDNFNKFMEECNIPVVEWDETYIRSSFDYIITIEPYEDTYYSIIKSLGIKLIYCEYGMDSISEDIWQNDPDHNKVQSAADILLVSTSEKADIMKSIYPDKFIINRKPGFDYPKFIAKSKDDLSEYKRVIMYAPHHTLWEPKENNPIYAAQYSTWDKFMFPFIRLVQSHPKWFFYYKPHPALRNRGRQGIADSYCEELRRYSNVKIIDQTEEYYQYFLNTDIMLTDCISFISEWIPMRKPLIRLVSNTTEKYSSRGENLIRDAFCTLNVDEDLDYIDSMIDANVEAWDPEPLNKYYNEVIDPNGNCNYIKDKLIIFNNIVAYKDKNSNGIIHPIYRINDFINKIYVKYDTSHPDEIIIYDKSSDVDGRTYYSGSEEFAKLSKIINNIIESYPNETGILRIIDIGR